MYRRWDVWLASVIFEDSPESKERPVLIMSGDSGIYILALKMTSHAPRNEDDYQLLEWEKAGLDFETTVRISKLCQIPLHCMKHKIGRLSFPDIRNLDKLIKQRQRSGGSHRQ